ncbi:MAG: carboxypeptidase regulatory-like domain-containing protein [Planctomycetota bacterium]|jgi:hypothetical protein|nr:carboxypeptidase regulatory-like domain-containing protein [Planctomycetota bacterium]MDP6941089.1 carboxypeptidase regulatory-like domain-containing protein [Planctomycetota bacterium]
MNYRKKTRGSAALIPIAILLAVLAAIAFMLTLSPSEDSSNDSDGPTLDSFNIEDGVGAQVDSPRLTQSPGRRTQAGSSPTADKLSRGEIHGSVTNESGEPVSNALVALTERLEQSAAFSLTPEEFASIPSFKVKTNEKGLFRFTRLQADTDYDMWVRHPEYAAKEGVPVTTLLENQTLNPIILNKGYQISGVVTDTAGNPLPASLIFQRQASRFVPRDVEELEIEDEEMGRRIQMVAQQDGSFIADLLPQGLWTLSVSHEGYAATRIHPLVMMGDNRSLEKKIELGTEHFLSGVVRTDDGTLVPGAKIQVSRMRPKPMFSSTGISEQDGTFKVGGLPEGLYGLSVQAAGYSASNLPRIKADKTDIEVVMHRLGSVAGRVLSDDGAPLRNFQLSLLSVNRGTALYVQNGRPKTFQDDNGNFLFEGINPGSYRLMAVADGFSSTYSTGFTVQRETVHGIDIHLQKGGKISGLVIDTFSGEPVAGAQVILHGKDWKEENSYGLFGGVGPDPNNVPKQEVATNKSGIFHFSNAYPDSLQIEVKHPAYLSSISSVNCSNGSNIDAGAFRLTRGGVITGTGKNSSGEPLAGGTAFLTLQVNHGFGYFSKNVRLDSQGRFRFEGLKSGDYKVSISSGQNGALLFMSEAAGSTTSVYVNPGATTQVDLISGQ